MMVQTPQFFDRWLAAAAKPPEIERESRKSDQEKAWESERASSVSRERVKRERLENRLGVRLDLGIWTGFRWEQRTDRAIRDLKVSIKNWAGLISGLREFGPQLLKNQVDLNYVRITNLNLTLPAYSGGYLPNPTGTYTTYNLGPG